jgi:acetoin utilization deacetylase AcuC-like enzyme
VHGDPTNFYPGVAGFADERGAGAGEGYNLNLPMAHGSSEADFLGQLEVALAAVKDFAAEVLVLSLGFDIFELDPQSKVAVTREGFARLGERIRSLGLPCLIVQEGGYHLESLEDNARAFFVGPEVWRI